MTPGQAVEELAQRDLTITRQRAEITALQQKAHERNLELDALHYVWCTGACERGQHRWCEGEVTEEMMATAALQMQRLRTRFGNERFKTLPREVQAAWFESEHFKRFMAERLGKVQQ